MNQPVMSDDLDSLRREVAEAAAAAASLEALDAVRVSALGRRGRITELMKTLGNLSPDERRERGRALNVVKDELTGLIEFIKSLE
jgi:phenylalanyl-tRNA synthetase alpha chain